MKDIKIMKHLSKIIVIVLSIGFLMQLAFNKNQAVDMSRFSTVGLELNYTVSEKPLVSQTEKAVFLSPFLDKSYVGFKEALGFRESGGRYECVNTLGYLGKYQFGKGTLKLLGVYNTSEFLKSSELQEKAFLANARRNKWILRRDIKNFVGKRVNGVLITESGILAAAHLAGPGNVKHYLRSYGALGFTDAFGTSIRNYLKKFSGFDVSFVIADQKAKVI